MIEASTESKARAAVAGSTSLNLKLCGLEVMSFNDGLMPLSFLTLIKPADCKRLSPRPRVVGSFGIAIVAPSGKSLIDL